MQTWITSDIHLGSRQCRADWVLAFLEKVPADVQLILNGDVVTRMNRESRMPDAHRTVLRKLRHLSRRQPVLWLGGNHDRRFALEGLHAIQRDNQHAIGKNVFVVHGDRFDHLMPSIRFLLLPLKVVYECCTRVVGSRTHVTDFAKRYPSIYRILNEHVIRHATEFAATQGYRAITCGHTHHPEHQCCYGVHYYNTGCWTEDAAHVLIVEKDGSIRMAAVQPDGSVRTDATEAP